jgi:hypothetical protein
VQALRGLVRLAVAKGALRMHPYIELFQAAKEVVQRWHSEPKTVGSPVSVTLRAAMSRLSEAADNLKEPPVPAVPAVYLVTSGEYSAYSIEAIFSTRELAEAYRKIIQSENDVEEMPIDAMREAVRCTIYQTCFEFTSGTVIGRSVTPDVVCSSARYSSVSVYQQPPQVNDRRIICEANSAISQEHADKLAVEARQEWLRSSDGVEAMFEYEKRLQKQRDSRAALLEAVDREEEKYKKQHEGEEGDV